MIDITQFSALKKTSANSFNNQKALIKKVMAGRKINCEVCNSELFIVLPEDSGTPGLYCKKGCTDILLDFSD